MRLEHKHHNLPSLGLEQYLQYLLPYSNTACSLNWVLRPFGVKLRNNNGAMELLGGYLADYLVETMHQDTNFSVVELDVLDVILALADLGEVEAINLIEQPQVLYAQLI
ncbi:MAG: hypothetical protein KBD78_13915 [Oligoflexales bacterium]|nr:hypothetical protein [Oligoflexales bacterium]